MARLAGRAEEQRLDQQSVRKTCTDQRIPTAEQDRALERVVWRCRELYNAGLHERKAAWETCGVWVHCALQSAQLPSLKEVRPAYRARNAPVVQDVVHRLDNAVHACFRRVQAGEHPGYPRVRGTDRSASCTDAQVGEHGGAVLAGGMLSLATLGRLPIRLQRSLHGTPKTVTSSREADGWSVAIAFQCRGAHRAAAAHRACDGHGWGAAGVAGLLGG